jgi:NADH-quinone oxidoreductase subunit L
MGNLRRLLPHIYWPFLIGALALSAFPLVGGFFSKDRILLATFVYPGVSYRIFWTLAAAAAFLTPLYTFRLFFLVFQERPEGRYPEEIKPVPAFMAWILWPLALLALFDGMLNLPFGPGKRWLGHYLSVLAGSQVEIHAPLAYELGMGLGSSLVVVAVIALAYYLYRPSGPGLRAPGWHPLLLEAFYLDKLYQHLFVRPYARASQFLWQKIDEHGLSRGTEGTAISLYLPYRWLAAFWWQSVDEGSLDRGLEGTAAGVSLLSKGLGSWTTGRLSTYVRMLLLGLTALISALAAGWYLW